MKNKVMIWFPILGLILTVLACTIFNTPSIKPAEGVAALTSTPTVKPKPKKNTATPTNTPEPTAAPTDTPEPTAAPTNTPEPTATPTDTPEPTATPTNTPEPTATPTDTPEPTPTLLPPTNTPIPRSFFEPLPDQARVCFINASLGTDAISYVLGGEQITVLPGFYQTMVGRDIMPGDYPLDIVTPGWSISSHFSVGANQTWCEIFNGAGAEGGYVYPNLEHPYLRGVPQCPPYCAE